VGKKEFVNTALKTITKHCLLNYITLRLQKETLCMVGMMTVLYAVCCDIQAPRMARTSTFTLNLIPLF
jgi:hypothetical protein